MLDQCRGEIPQDVLDSLARTRVGLKGPVTTPVAGGFQSVNVALRKQLDLFANVRPVRMLPGLKTRYRDTHIDLVIFRENTEDLYAGHRARGGQGRGHQPEGDHAHGLRADRPLRVRLRPPAGTQEGDRGPQGQHHEAERRPVPALRREVAREYPEIEYNELIVDNACMQLVMRPEKFDVLLMPNLYGDIVSDLSAGLVGGLGVVPGANIGEKHAVFEAVHGSAPDIAGKGIANPTALMQSAVLMLEHLGELDAAKRLQAAIERVYTEGRSLTGDVGGTASTKQFTDAVLQAM